MKTLSVSVAFAGFAFFSSMSPPVHATTICDQQFEQCISDGIYPRYKCEELRALCESVYGVVPARQDPTDRKEIARALPAEPAKATMPMAGKRT